MAGIFTASNIQIGSLTLGQWNVVEDEDKLKFLFNSSEQVIMNPDATDLQPDGIQSVKSLSLGIPTIMERKQKQVVVGVDFKEDSFSSRNSEAFGLKINYSNKYVRCKAMDGSYLIGEFSNDKYLVVTKNMLSKKSFKLEFVYTDVPDSIACSIFPSTPSNANGASLIESIPFGIKFVSPKRPYARLMNSVSTTSGTAGGTISDSRTELNGLVIVNSQNLVPSQYDGSTTATVIPNGNSVYKTMPVPLVVGLNNPENFEFLAKLVDLNGIVDVKNITIRFYQFYTQELTGVYETDYSYAQSNYSSRHYKSIQIGMSYSSPSSFNTFSSHSDVNYSTSGLPGYEQYFNHDIAVYKLTQNSHQTLEMEGQMVSKETHSTNLYLRFKLSLDDSLKNNEFRYIVPFIYINNSSTPVPLSKDITLLNFDNISTHNTIGYAVAHVDSSISQVSVYTGSYKKLNANTSLEDPIYASKNTYFTSTLSGTWAWNPSTIELDKTLSSEYIIIENSSNFNTCYNSISFNGNKFNGNKTSINIENNMRFICHIIDNTDGSLTQERFENGTSPVNLLDLNGNTDDVVDIRHILSPNTDGSFVIEIPKKSIAVIQFMVLSLPDYLPVDIYTQTYTITDISDFTNNPLSFPLYTFSNDIGSGVQDIVVQPEYSQVLTFNSGLYSQVSINNYFDTNNFIQFVVNNILYRIDKTYVASSTGISNVQTYDNLTGNFLQTLNSTLSFRSHFVVSYTYDNVQYKFNTETMHLEKADVGTQYFQTLMLQRTPSHNVSNKSISFIDINNIHHVITIPVGYNDCSKNTSTNMTEFQVTVADNAVTDISLTFLSAEDISNQPSYAFSLSSSFTSESTDVVFVTFNNSSCLYKESVSSSDVNGINTNPIITLTEDTTGRIGTTYIEFTGSNKYTVNLLTGKVVQIDNTSVNIPVYKYYGDFVFM